MANTEIMGTAYHQDVAQTAPFLVERKSTIMFRSVEQVVTEIWSRIDGVCLYYPHGSILEVYNVFSFDSIVGHICCADSAHGRRVDTPPAISGDRAWLVIPWLTKPDFSNFQVGDERPPCTFRPSLIILALDSSISTFFPLIVVGISGTSSTNRGTWRALRPCLMAPLSDARREGVRV